jgi:hypothetical protein
MFTIYCFFAVRFFFVAKFLYVYITGQHHQCLYENGGGGSVTHENGFARHTTPEFAATSPVLSCCQQNILKNIERKPSADADEKELLENEIKHLLEIESLRRKLEETERAMTRIISQMGNIPHKAQVRIDKYVYENQKFY